MQSAKCRERLSKLQCNNIKRGNCSKLYILCCDEQYYPIFVICPIYCANRERKKKTINLIFGDCVLKHLIMVLKYFMIWIHVVYQIIYLLFHRLFSFTASKILSYLCCQCNVSEIKIILQYKSIFVNKCGRNKGIRMHLIL